MRPQPRTHLFQESHATSPTDFTHGLSNFVFDCHWLLSRLNRDASQDVSGPRLLEAQRGFYPQFGLYSAPTSVPWIDKIFRVNARSAIYCRCVVSRVESYSSVILYDLQYCTSNPSNTAYYTAQKVPSCLPSRSSPSQYPSSTL